MEQDVNLSNYTIRFSVVYCVGVVVLSIIFNIFNLDHSMVASMGVLVIAASMSVTKFIQDNKRVPNKTEKTRLVWSSLFITWVVSVMLIISVVFALEGGAGIISLIKLSMEINIPIVVGAAFFVSLLSLAVLSYSYGTLAKKQYDGLLKKGKI